MNTLEHILAALVLFFAFLWIVEILKNSSREDKYNRLVHDRRKLLDKLWARRHG